MAIAFDATKQRGISVSGVSSGSYSHTCTGDALLLLVAVWHDTAQSVSGITYNGVSLSALNTGAETSNNTTLTLMYLLAPATGANTIAVTLSGNSTTFDVSSASYTGVGALHVEGATNHASGTSLDNTLTSTIDNCWHIGVAIKALSSLTSFTGGTVRIQSGKVISDSPTFVDDPVATAGANTITANFGGSTGGAIFNAAMFVPFTESNVSVPVIGITISVPTVAPGVSQSVASPTMTMTVSAPVPTVAQVDNKWTNLSKTDTSPTIVNTPKS